VRVDKIFVYHLFSNYDMTVKWRILEPNIFWSCTDMF